MTLKYSGLKIILRSVELKNLPVEALAVSPQSTVPSLAFSQEDYIDESWDIMQWALTQNDPQNWLGNNNEYLLQAESLVLTNDNAFKQELDHYKYADRYPQQSAEYYRTRCLGFLEQLNHRLTKHPFLLSATISIADIALFPFVRQFAMVDSKWFDQAPYPALQNWLSILMKSEWFKHAFHKHDIWRPQHPDIYI